MTFQEVMTEIKEFLAKPLYTMGETEGTVGTALVVALMIVAKTGVIYLFANIGGLDRPSQIATGLSQLGEFSFVLVSVLYAAGSVTPELYAGLLATITLTIGASAVAVRLPIAGWVRGSDEHHEHSSSPAGSA